VETQHRDDRRGPEDLIIADVTRSVGLLTRSASERPGSSPYTG
jgi:hypothetical protein